MAVGYLYRQAAAAVAVAAGEGGGGGEEVLIGNYQFRVVAAAP
jgi:hypothetical protein